MSDLFTTRGQWSRSAGLSLHCIKGTVTQTHWSKMNHSPSFTFLYLLSRSWATVTCFTSSLHTRRGNFISQPLFELFSISFALHAYHAFCIALNVHLHHWFFKLKLQMLLFYNIWASQVLMWEEMLTLNTSLDIWSSILQALKTGLSKQGIYQYNSTL